MRVAAGPPPLRPQTIAIAAPLASAVAAGLALVALVFGELPLYGADPGVRPNQYVYGVFESRGIYVYPLVLLAGALRLAGAMRASRWLSAGVVAVTAVIVMWPAPIWMGSGRPPLPLLLTIAACCVPAALSGAPTDARSLRWASAATIAALAVAGALSFSGRPHGHPNWDPRSVFYLQADGVVATWRPFAPLAVLIILGVAAGLAARRRRIDLWHAASWSMLPAVLATYGPRQWSSVSASYHRPLQLMLVLLVAVVAIDALLSYRSRRSADTPATPGRAQRSNPPH